MYQPIKARLSLTKNGETKEFLVSWKRNIVKSSLGESCPSCPFYFPPDEAWGAIEKLQQAGAPWPAPLRSHIKGLCAKDFDKTTRVLVARNPLFSPVKCSMPRNRKA